MLCKWMERRLKFSSDLFLATLFSYLNMINSELRLPVYLDQNLKAFIF